MSNLASMPNINETVTGGKTLEMSKYDKVRKPHRTITDDTQIKITTRTLSTELSCPICLDLLTSTMTTKECLHRFCSECINTWLQKGNRDCPTCRKKIVSKRSLRPDPNFDCLINKIWPDRRVYEEMQNASMNFFQQYNNVEALQKSIEEGMRAQAPHRRSKVKGSYDYEKRKRRPKLSENATTSAEKELGADGVQHGNVTVPLSPANVHHHRGGSSGRNNQLDATGNGRSRKFSSSDEEGDQETGTKNQGDFSESDEEEKYSLKKAAGSKRRHDGRQKSCSSSSRGRTSSQNGMGKNGSKKKPHSSNSLNKMVRERSSSTNSSGTLSTVLTAPESIRGSIEPFFSDDSNGEEDEGTHLNRPVTQVDIRNMMEKMRRNNDEIELELAPTQALRSRLGSVPYSHLLLKPLYIKAPVDATMDHFGELLLNIYRREFQQETDRLAEQERETEEAKREKERAEEETAANASNKKPQLEEGEIDEDDDGEGNEEGKEKTKNGNNESGDGNKTANKLSQNPKTNTPEPCITEAPNMFYIVNRFRQVRALPGTETLFSAFYDSILSESHFILFYDIGEKKERKEMGDAEPKIEAMSVEELAGEQRFAGVFAMEIPDPSMMESIEGKEIDRQRKSGSSENGSTEIGGEPSQISRFANIKKERMEEDEEEGKEEHSREFLDPSTFSTDMPSTVLPSSLENKDIGTAPASQKKSSPLPSNTVSAGDVKMELQDEGDTGQEEMEL